MKRALIVIIVFIAGAWACNGLQSWLENRGAEQLQDQQLSETALEQARALHSAADALAKQADANARLIDEQIKTQQAERQVLWILGFAVIGLMIILTTLVGYLVWPLKQTKHPPLEPEA